MLNGYDLTKKHTQKKQKRVGPDKFGQECKYSLA